ncbi:MAG: hypothetical protein ACLTQI_05415 [Slackia sp.]
MDTKALPRPRCPFREDCRRRRTFQQTVRASRRTPSQAHRATTLHASSAALREVLGDRVSKPAAPSAPTVFVSTSRISSMTAEQISEERVANSVIMQALPMNIYETSLDEARESA